jgi:predicted patatin/cPLA2 family phospholipase
MTRTALIVEGGAMRGIFACGVLDRFIERDFYPFEWNIGVSAGASNVAAYLARMGGRNRRVYMDYSLRPQFMNPWRLVTGGHMMDLDWLWQITVREMPVDLDTLFGRAGRLLVGVTCAETGAFEFLEPTRANLYDALKASSALPVAYRNLVRLDGRVWADGGVSSAIPVRETWARGASTLMVVRSRHYGYAKSVTLPDRLAPLFLRGQPALARSMRRCHLTYQANLEFIRNPPPGARVVEVCPPDDFTVSRTTRDRHALARGYAQGMEAAETAMRQWHALQP